MHRKTGLYPFWLVLGVLVVACSSSDDGVGSTRSDEDRSESGDDANDGEGDDDDDDDDDDDRPAMDAGSPDEHEIIEVEAPDATCAATSAEAPKVVTQKEVVTMVPRSETKPVAIYLMLDRSSSMIGYCPGSTCNRSSWDQAAQAITAFARDPASSNIDVALGYFPPIVPVAQENKAAQLCSGNVCGAATVAVRRANDNAAPVTDSLAAARPPMPDILFGPPPLYTPTECALRGMDAFCKAHTMASGQKCVGVLVTDGVPQGDCSVDANNLANIAATTAAGGTRIFTLGLTGANFDFLNRIAMSGNTDCTPNAAGNACDATAGTAAFVAALNAIRETVVTTETRVETVTETVEVPLECEWKLPQAPEGMKFDKEKVNVTFTAQGKEPVALGRVSSEEECGRHPEGWRYDSEEDPTKVLACPSACERIKSATGAKINIEFGCKGKTLE